jgi:pimeloyl-ACP methyl ester carboxylesterase
MKPTVILIPGGFPKASESIFQAINKTLVEAKYEVMVLEKAGWKDLESKAGSITSKILVGKSAGGRLVVEYQIKHKDAKALVLLAAAAKAREQVREIKIPVLIIHGTADRVVPIENSRELVKQFENSRLVEVQGADHRYKGKEQETAKIIADWIKSLRNS